jgi:hypothetical protein
MVLFKAIDARPADAPDETSALSLSFSWSSQLLLSLLMQTSEVVLFYKLLNYLNQTYQLRRKATALSQKTLHLQFPFQSRLQELVERP